MMKKSIGLSVALFLIFIAPASAQEKVTHIRIQGNFTIPDDEIIALSGLNIGDEIDDKALEEARKRILKSGKFESAEVLKRYRSISGSGPVAIVIIVEEKEAFARKLLFFPILDYNDDYGFTYGLITSSIDLLGMEERISIPLSWGGEKLAALQVEFSPELPVLNTIFLEARRSRREHPHYELDVDRSELNAHVGTRAGYFMISALAGWAKVEFAALEERYNSIGLRTMFDTRSNIVNPGNSVYAAAEWKRLMFDEREEDIDVVSVDLRGYFRVVGRTMIAGQARFDTASTALPLYLKPFMGGSSSLRGYESGEFIGDNRFTCSLELRQPVLPLDTPIDAGVYVFYDTGKVYEDGFAFGDVDYHDSFGIGSYAFAMGFGLRIDIGRNEEGDTRFHLMTAMKF